MTVHSLLNAARLRAARALSSARGAFDLPSIITGVVVVAILTAGVFAAVFGVIPFAQDKGAKQDLSAVRTAEGVAKAKDSRFLGSADLNDSGYISARTGLAVGTDESGSCWVGFAKSGAGTVFYATAETMDPQAYTSGTDTGCLSAEEQADLLAATGAGMPAAPDVPAASAEPAAPAGYVAGWGYNYTGQIAGGTYTSSTVPINSLQTGLLAGKTVTGLSGSTEHSCAISDGAAYCWGINTYGQLGNNTTAKSNLPVLVSGFADKTVTAVSAGINHSCAIADGAVYCWGSNANGQLGNGTLTDSRIPVAVTATELAGKTLTSLSTAGFHSCVAADGKAHCWGRNDYGQLGDGTLVQKTAPVAVTTAGVLNGLTVTSLDGGTYHTCTIASEGVYCWGSGNSGRLGNGGTADSAVPVAVTGLAGKKVSSLSAGGANCVIADDNGYCWGYGLFGAIGNGGTSDAKTARAVAGLLAGKTIDTISTGGRQSCATADGKAYCWGGNSYGQIGDGTTNQANLPVDISASGALNGKRVVNIVAGAWSTLALYS